MRLGKAGVAGLAEDTFNGPCAIVTSANGDIFVADGHENNISRIVKPRGRAALSGPADSTRRILFYPPPCPIPARRVTGGTV